METQPLPLERIGQRFSIRLHDPAGGYRDVVGHLKTATSLINRKGQEISFDPEQIFVWREIVERPTLAGKGAPLTLRVLELDQICNLTWPATEELENSGWLMRAANGVTNRANSVLPLEANLEVGALTDFDKKLAVAQEFYKARNLPTIFQVALPTWQLLSDKLRSMGAVETLCGNTMVADLTSSKQIVSTEFEIVQSNQPSDEWLAVQPTPGIEKIMSGCASTYLTVVKNGKAIATCRFALAKGWSSITRVYVHPDFRGQGLAKAIVAAALEASFEQGATKAVLQVDASNAIAIGVYESLGFNFHHEYSFLVLS
jgi:ribosomal protein S18 acetylase RimI-like enzyme